MIFPAGKPKNLNGTFNPITDDPRSPSYEPELKKNVKKAEREDFEPQAAMKFADAHQGMPRMGSIGSAQCANLSSLGGTVRQMKTATSNSIWDSAVLERIQKGEGEVTQGEQIKADNEKLAASRQEARRQQFTIDKDAVLAAMKPANAISPAHVPTAEQSNYKTKIASSQMSIFQSDNAFEQLPEKTAGEMIGETKQARREAARKDRSWERVQPAQSTRQQLRDFFRSNATGNK